MAGAGISILQLAANQYKTAAEVHDLGSITHSKTGITINFQKILHFELRVFIRCDKLQRLFEQGPIAQLVRAEDS